MKRLLLASVITTLGLAACSGTPQIIQVPGPAAAAPVDKPAPQFTVTGLAKLEVVPNCADLMLTIAADASRSAQATSQALAQQQELVKRLEAAGVTRADIKLSSVQISPQFAYSSSGSITSRKFRAEIRVTVTTRDFAKLSDLMDAGAGAGVTAMSSSFRHDKIEELKSKVRDDALKAARAKAAQTASGLGFTVGAVVGVNETPTGHLWNGGYFPRSVVANVSEAMASDGFAGLGVETQDLSVSVDVSFEIKPS